MRIAALVSTFGASTPILWIMFCAVASKGAMLADPKCILVLAGICMLAGVCGMLFFAWAGQTAKAFEAHR